jgi:hypothetical protein
LLGFSLFTVLFLNNWIANFNDLIINMYSKDYNFQKPNKPNPIHTIENSDFSTTTPTQTPSNSIKIFKNTINLGQIEVDESYFGARRVRGKRGCGALGKTIVLGLLKRGDKVYAEIVLWLCCIKLSSW